MAQLLSTQAIGPNHLIGALALKLIALAVAALIREDRMREIVPVIGVIYAASLPVLLWIFAP